MKINLKKGDKVIVLSGKDRGKTGLIDRVSVKSAEIIVNGMNIMKKHVKVSKKYPSGGVVEIARPMPVGKVQVICPVCNKPTRIGFEIKGKEKNRVCKKCHKVIVASKETKEK